MTFSDILNDKSAYEALGILRQAVGMTERCPCCIGSSSSSSGTSSSSSPKPPCEILVTVNVDIEECDGTTTEYDQYQESYLVSEAELQSGTACVTFNPGPIPGNPHFQSISGPEDRNPSYDPETNRLCFSTSILDCDGEIDTFTMVYKRSGCAVRLSCTEIYHYCSGSETGAVHIWDECMNHGSDVFRWKPPAFPDGFSAVYTYTLPGGGTTLLTPDAEGYLNMDMGIICESEAGARSATLSIVYTEDCSDESSSSSSSSPPSCFYYVNATVTYHDCDGTSRTQGSAGLAYADSSGKFARGWGLHRSDYGFTYYLGGLELGVDKNGNAIIPVDDIACGSTIYLDVVAMQKCPESMRGAEDDVSLVDPL